MNVASQASPVASAYRSVQRPPPGHGVSIEAATMNGNQDQWRQLRDVLAPMLENIERQQAKAGIAKNQGKAAASR